MKRDGKTGIWAMMRKKIWKTRSKMEKEKQIYWC